MKFRFLRCFKLAKNEIHVYVEPWVILQKLATKPCTVRRANATLETGRGAGFIAAVLRQMDLDLIAQRKLRTTIALKPLTIPHARHNALESI